MVLFSFDHIVHYCEDPHQVIPFLKEKGIHAVIGGEHQRRPTYNVLSYFDLSYIEFIGTSDREELQEMDHGPFSMIQTIIDSDFSAGFKRFVLRTNDIEAAKDHFLKEGLQVNGPVALSRKKPDGSILEWKLLFIGRDNDRLEYPYMIQWGKEDDLLRRDLINEGAIDTQDQQLKISHINIAVKDLPRTIKHWSRLFGL